MRFVTISFDIRNSIRLCLALLLFAVAVGPACLLMSPAMAMASDTPSEGCGTPAAPGTSSVDCPHKTADSEINAVSRNSVDMVSVPPAVPVGPVTAPDARSCEPAAAIPQRPVAHLTPLRL